ncbi:MULTISPECIES: AraC family transcriptional regulator [Agrobacterium tumefaciens complex]|uniref:AraC family transcriptional regulator n=1 Tax=Agrobacterium tumefaciens TaxID=358 RepID=UPI000FE2819A|nr:AraC family transcriptional regulator [Agrobacterium tumefaciens]QAB00937.1 AraC family transcriptional regulator [Agrobacterium tumefaciens]
MRNESTQNRMRMESPQFERIAPTDGESFVWRIDDYPWRKSVWNCHPEVEIHLIRHGTGTALIGDYVGEFASGELMIVGSWLPHDWISHCKHGELIKGRDLVVQFDAKAIESAASVFPEFSSITELLGRALNGVRFGPVAARVLGDEMERVGGLSGAMRLTAFLSLLADMAACTDYTVLSSTRTPMMKKKDLETMQAIISFIQGNLSRDVSLSEIAEVADMTQTSSSRFFKKHAGLNYVEFMTRLRIGKACALLRTSNDTVSTISFECGYTNISNFNRRFLLLQGCTPSEYRKRHHQ